MRSPWLLAMLTRAWMLNAAQETLAGEASPASEDESRTTKNSRPWARTTDNQGDNEQEQKIRVEAFDEEGNTPHGAPAENTDTAWYPPAASTPRTSTSGTTVASSDCVRCGASDKLPTAKALADCSVLRAGQYVSVRHAKVTSPQEWPGVTLPDTAKNANCHGKDGVGEGGRLSCEEMTCWPVPSEASSAVLANKLQFAPEQAIVGNMEASTSFSKPLRSMQVLNHRPEVDVVVNGPSPASAASEVLDARSAFDSTAPATLSVDLTTPRTAEAGMSLLVHPLFDIDRPVLTGQTDAADKIQWLPSTVDVLAGQAEQALATPMRAQQPDMTSSAALEEELSVVRAQVKAQGAEMKALMELGGLLKRENDSEDPQVRALSPPSPSRVDCRLCQAGWDSQACAVCKSGAYREDSDLDTRPAHVLAMSESLRVPRVMREASSDDQLRARVGMQEETTTAAGSCLSNRLASEGFMTNVNVPARKPHAVPALVRGAQSWFKKPTRDGHGSKPSGSSPDAKGMFGVRLLTAIQHEQTKWLDGIERLSVHDQEISLPAHSHQPQVHAHAVGGSGASYSLDRASRSRHRALLPPTAAHESAARVDEYEAAHRRRHLFPGMGEKGRARQRIADKAASTWRAAGAAVSKLWFAAGKALAEEADLSPPQDVQHYPSKPGQWQKFFARIRAASGGGRADTGDTKSREPFSSSRTYTSVGDQSLASQLEEACSEGSLQACALRAKAVLEDAKRQHVSLLEANLWGRLLAKRLEMTRSNPDLAQVSAAAWTPGRWAGVFVQDVYTELEMELEISEVSAEGPCRGFITWANGHSITEVECSVRGNQINLEETRVLSDSSGGEFVSGTRYRLWKDGGDHADMEGTWLHSELMLWGYLHLRNVHQALARMDVGDFSTHNSAPEFLPTRARSAQAAAEGTHRSKDAVAESTDNGDDRILAGSMQSQTEWPMARSAEPGSAPWPVRPQRLAADAVQEPLTADTWLRIACALVLVGVLMSTYRAMLRQWIDAARTACMPAQARLGRGDDGKPASTRRKACKAAPQIDIPADAFRAVGRSVLRNSSCSSVPSPSSSVSSSAGTVSPHGWPSLGRARELLLTSTMSSTASGGTTSSVGVSDALGLEVEADSKEHREELELKSVAELDRLRQSIGQEHAFLLDSSWVIPEEVATGQDSVPGSVQEDSSGAATVSQHVSPALSAGKAPRVSDVSGAPTAVGDRLDSAGRGDRSISLGWLAVDDAEAVVLSELSDAGGDA